MMEGPDPVPYEEIKKLCDLLGVPFNVYNVKTALEQAIVQIQTGCGLLPKKG